MAKIGINAGHTKIGAGTGANKYLNESNETRKLACEIMKQLADTNHEVVPLIYDKSNNNLKEAVSDANKKGLDLFISVHLNAGGGQGSEIYTWKGEHLPAARITLHNLNRLGFKNRGIKDGSNLYIIKNTKMPAILVEVCFLDNQKDVQLYKQAGHKAIAEAIVNAIK